MELPRRDAQHSSEDSPVSQSSSSRAEAMLINQLSALHDQLLNESVIRDLDLQDNSPEQVLFKVLTPQPLQQCQSRRSSVEYRVIGFGQCGLVFEKPGQAFVLKTAKRSYEDALWNDFRAHLHVYHAFDEPQNQGMDCRIPQVFSYVAKGNNKWWEEKRSLFPPLHESVELPAMTLITQRILPLPKVAREALINKYCAASRRLLASSNPTNRDCLARVYLGRRRTTTTPPPNFTLRNFNLHLDQMVELGLPVKNLAKTMGESLAVIHWTAKVDGYDIEFVLGSDGDIKYKEDCASTLNLCLDEIDRMPQHTDVDSLLESNFMRRTTRLWILDFNLCNIWDEAASIYQPEALTSHLVEAFFENDPYYPLPLMENDLEKELWEVFSVSYLAKAHEELQIYNPRLACLPQKFIDGCIQREMESVRKGLGHGHREMKQ